MDVVSWFRVLFGITVECLLQTVAVLPVRTPGSAMLFPAGSGRLYRVHGGGESVHQDDPGPAGHPRHTL